MPTCKECGNKSWDSMKFLGFREDGIMEFECEKCKAKISPDV